MTTTITTFNGRISTQGIIRQNGDYYSASIVQNYSDGDVQFIDGKDYKTQAGAQRFIEQYRTKKQAAFNKGELVEGVVVC